MSSSASICLIWKGYIFDISVILRTPHFADEMMCKELDSIEPEAFHTELVKTAKCLADYYEKIRDMEGAGGLRVAKSFKHKFKEIKEIRVIYIWKPDHLACFSI